MEFRYETPRLILSVLKADHGNSEKVLDFYERDRELFEKYEPERVPNYYTASFHKSVLKYEYSMAVGNAHIRYHVFEKDNPDVIIGTVCLHNIQTNYYSRCEIGYKFSSSVHRRGYAKEAINQVIFAAFDDLGIHSINAWVDVENIASLGLLRKLGFEEEGICKDYIYKSGKWHDHVQFRMLNPFQE